MNCHSHSDHSSELPAWPAANPRGLGRIFVLAAVTAIALALFCGWAQAAAPLLRI
jgi:ribosome biogenesis protein Tsr3